jgi:hypothetical protein
MLAASESTARQPLKFPFDCGKVLAPARDASHEQRPFSVPLHGRHRLDINLCELLDESRDLFEQPNARALEQLLKILLKNVKLYCRRISRQSC